jgi:hypothetical protein
MAVINGTVTGVSLLRASASGGLKTYLVTCNFPAYTGASDTATVTGLGAAILGKNRNGKTHTLKGVHCMSAGKDAAAAPLDVFFTGTAAWAATISSDDATGHLAVAAGTEITSTTGTTVGVELAVTVLES